MIAGARGADGASADSRSRRPGRIGLGGERTTRRGRGGRRRVPGGTRRSPSTSSSYGSRTPVSPPAATSRRPPPLSSSQVLGRRSPSGVEHPPGRSAASMAGSSTCSTATRSPVCYGGAAWPRCSAGPRRSGCSGARRRPDVDRPRSARGRLPRPTEDRAPPGVALHRGGPRAWPPRNRTWTGVERTSAQTAPSRSPRQRRCPPHREGTERRSSSGARAAPAQPSTAP